MKAVVISVGDEILNGETLNRDLAIIADFLHSLGISIGREITVADNLDEIGRVLKESLKEFDIIFLTGGLGPTEDDVTREAVSKALNLELRFDDKLFEKIKFKLEGRGVEVGDIHKKYGFLPEGFTHLENEVGVAPGLYGEIRGKKIFILPGPPRELTSTLNAVYPHLKDISKKKILSIKIRTFGLREAEIAEMLSPYMEELSPIGFYPSLYGVDLRLRGEGESEERIREELERKAKKIEEILGDNVYGRDGDTLESVLGSILRKAKLKLAIAESCTGGLVSDIITNVPGSSEYFIGSIVAYHNDLKINFLGVEPTILKEFGAVSEPTAKRMAEGVRKLYDVDVGLSTTGIAGPTGGTPSKPVGLVYMGVSIGGETRVIKRIFRGNRLEVKRQTAYTVIDLARRVLIEMKKEK
jgi:nicotinamide-nucleotide amidase